MLHGRTDEVDRLRDLLKTAAEGRSAAAVFVGEPGAGKSALLDAACDLAPEATILLRAWGVGSESDLPFAGLQQLLRPILDRLDRLPGQQQAALRGALGIDSTGTSDTHNVSLGVLTLLGEAAEDGPVLAVVDDAHWLDHESARALVFAARRLHAEGVVMLFAARTGQFDAASLSVVHLGPLDADAVAGIIREGSDTTMPYDVAQQVAAATGGNALAVAELASLLTSGQISGRDPLPLNLPVSARTDRLFIDRIKGLSRAGRDVLLIAAADDTGSTSAVFAAAEITGCGPEGLEEAERLGLVKADGIEVRFRHPLVRSSVYGAATFGERVRAHAALAEVFEESGDQDRAAWHRATAAVAPDEQAAHGLEEAATRAHLRAAYATAATAYEKAGELSGTDEQRGLRLAAAAGEAWLAGLLPRAARLVGTAETLIRDPGMLADCYRLRGSIELATGATPSTVAILVKAARHTVEVDPGRALELLALAGEGASLGVDTGAASEIREIAATVATSESIRDGFFARLLVGFTRLADEPETASAALHQAMAFAEDETEDVDLLLAAGRAAFYVGDDAAALKFHGRILDRARRVASVGCLAIAGTRMALAEMLVGMWGAGLATAEETSRMAEDTGQMELAAHALVWQGLVAAWRGESEECRQLTNRARVITAQHPMVYVEDGTRWVDGVLELGLGRAANSAAHLRGIVHPVIANAASLDGVEAASLAGDAAQVERWMSALVDAATRSDAAWARARLAHARALLADDPVEAEEQFSSALSEHNQGKRSFERARTELAYGTFLRRQRKRVDARGPLRSALTTFEELGATPWADRAHAELRASGETARRRDSSTIRDLTPQELQVARFVVQGMTNREVAAQMFLSPRTIDYHLRSVFTKLGITSRTELANLRDELPISASVGN